MKRLAVEQEVALSVGDATVDCRVAALSGGEAALAPLDPADSGLLPAASAGASLVFTHGGRLVMLRGAMYRATGEADLRFAEKSSGSGPVVAEQRRKAARLPITLPATIRQLDDEGTPFGEERQLVTRDISIGGFAVAMGVGGFSRRARPVRAHPDERRDAQRHGGRRARRERDVRAALRAARPGRPRQARGLPGRPAVGPRAAGRRGRAGSRPLGRSAHSRLRTNRTMSASRA